MKKVRLAFGEQLCFGNFFDLLRAVFFIFRLDRCCLHLPAVEKKLPKASTTSGSDEKGVVTVLCVRQKLVLRTLIRSLVHFT
jgi:hypothetical protein